MSIPYNIKLNYIYESLQPQFVKSYDNAEPVTFDVSYVKKLMEDTQHLCNNIDKDTMNTLQWKYLREVYISETGQSKITTDKATKLDKVVEAIIENYECSLDDECDLRMYKKCKNICTALEYVLYTDTSNIDKTLIVKLHELVGKDIINNIGMYRTTHARPMGTTASNSPYYNHKTIPERIATLLKFTNDKLMEMRCIDNPFVKIEWLLKLTTVMFSEFLLIHPFSNGNGRVARLLAQCLFKHMFQIPISLYVDADDRSRYIKVLDFRINYKDTNGCSRNRPDYLYGYFIECVHKHYVNILNMY
jgi:Fic family protein